MSEDIYKKIHDSDSFHRFVARKKRFTWGLSILMLCVYFTFILVIAFAPSLLGIPLSDTGVTTLGIPVGVAIILFAFVLTGLYVRKANSEFDREIRKIVEEAIK